MNPDQAQTSGLAQKVIQIVRPILYVGVFFIASLIFFGKGVTIFHIHEAAASACATNGTGALNWSATGSWTSCNSTTPQSGDTVTIGNNVQMTLDTTATISGLTFAAASNANNTSLTHSGSNALTVNGTVSIHQPGTNSITNAWNINAGSATVSGLITFQQASTTTTRINKIVLTTGTLSANGGMTVASGTNTPADHIIDMSGGASTLNFKGTFTSNAVANTAAGWTFTMGTTSTINYNDSSAQSLSMPGSGAYANITINNTAGVTLTAAISAANVTGNITVGDGTIAGVLKNGAFAVVGNAGKSFTVSNGATFSMTGGSNNLPTGFTLALDSAAHTSTVEYNQTTSITLTTAITYGNLSFKNASGTITFTLPATLTINGNLVVGGGGGTTIMSGATNNPTTTVSGTTTVNNLGTITQGATQVVTFNGNATIGGGTTGTFTGSGAAVNINGDLTLAVGSTWTKGAGTVTFQKGGTQTWTDSTAAGKDLGTVVIAVNGTNTTVNLAGLPTATGLTINASQTLSVQSSTLTTSTINNAGNLNGNTGIIVLSGVTAPFTNSGTFTYNTSTVRYTANIGTGALALSGSGGTNGYYNLELKPSGSTAHAMAAGTYQINNNFVVGNGTNQGANADTNDPNITVLGNLTVAAGATFTASSAGTMSVTGSTTITGTYSHGNGTWAQTGDLTINGTLSGAGTGGITANADVVGTGTVSLTGGLFTQSITVNKNFGTTSGVNGWSFKNLTFTATSDTATLQAGTGTITATGVLTISASTTLDAQARTIILSGTTTPFVNSGTFTYGTSIMRYTGNGATGIAALSGSSGTNGYYDLELKPSSSSAQPLATGTYQVNHNLIVGNGTNQGANADTNDPTINVTGTMTVAAGATYTASSASLLTVTGTTTITGTYTTGAGGFTENGDLAVNGTLSGTANGTITVAGAVSGSGTVTLTTAGTFIQRVVADKAFGSSSAANNWAFFNLTLGNSNGVSHTITASSGGSGTITITGTLTVGKSGDSFPTILDASNRTWILANTTTPLVFNSSGTITANTSIFRYTGNGAPIAAITYYDLELKPSAATAQVLGTGASQTITVNNNLIVGNGTNAGAQATTNNPNLVVGGSVTTAAGATFTAPGSGKTFSVGGDFTTTGTFTHNSGTVTFTGAVIHNINGAASVTFNNISDTVAGSTLKFLHHTTNVPKYTVAGTMTITGTSPSHITITSDDGANPWLVHFNSAQLAITYATISYGACDAGTSNATLDSTNTDAGNNGVCWVFTPAVVVSGILYDTDGSTAWATVTAMKVAINGSSSSTTNSVVTTGVFSFNLSATPVAGDVITVWLDTAGATSGSLVFKYGASCNGGGGGVDCTGLKVIKDAVTINNKHTGSIVNTDFAACDSDSGAACSDADIGFTSTAGALTVTFTNGVLTVPTGVIFAPGGDVTSPYMNVAGTYTGASEVLTLSGYSQATSGSVTYESVSSSDDSGGAFSSVITFSHTVNAGSNRLLMVGISWYNPAARNLLTVKYGGVDLTKLDNSPLAPNGDGRSEIWYLLAPTVGTANVVLTFDAGVYLTVGAISFSSVNQSTPFGTPVSTSGAANTAHTITLTSATGEMGLGVVHWSSSADTATVNQTQRWNIISGTTEAGAGATASGAPSITFTWTESGTQSGWDAIGVPIKPVAGVNTPEPLIVGGTYTANSNTTRFTGNGAVKVPNLTYNNLELKPTANSPTYKFGNASSQTITAANVTIGNGTNAVTADLATYDPTFNVSGVLTVAASAIMDAGDSAITLSGTTGTPLVATGTFTATNSTVAFTGNNSGGNTTIPALIYNNLTLNNGSETFALGGAIITNGDLTMTAGTLSGTNNITINGGDVTGNGDINMTGGTFTVDGAGNFGGSTDWDFNNLTFGDSSGSTTTTTTSTSTIGVAGVLTIAANQTLNAGSKIWTLSGTTGTPFVITGTFTPSTSTFVYSGNNAGGNTSVVSTTYNHLTFNNGSETYAVASGGIVANGDLTITAGTLDTVAGQNNTIEVGGSWSNAGTFTARNGLVLFTSSATGKTLSGTLNGTSAFYDLYFSNISGSWTNSSAVLVTNDLTITNGTFYGTADVTVNGGDASGNGVITRTGGTFLLDGGGSFGGSGNWTFNNLTLGDGTGATLTAASGSGNITTTGVLTVAANQQFDAGSKTWVLSGTGTPFVITGTFIADGSTFQYTGGSGTTNITSTTYVNLQLLPSNASSVHRFATGTVTVTGNTVLGDSTSVSSATIDFATNNPNLTLNGNLTLCGSCSGKTITVSKGSGTITLAPAGTKILTDSNTTPQDIGVLALVSGSATPKINLGSSVKATSVSIAASHTLDVNGANTLTLTGNSSPLSITGTFTPSTGTVDFSSAATTGTTIPSITYYNLTVNKASNTFTPAAGTLVVTNALNITAGTFNLNTNDPTTTLSGVVTNAGTFEAPSTGNLTLQDDFINNGTFNANGGAVVISAKASGAPNTTAFRGSAGITFNNLTINTPGRRARFQDGLTYVFGGALTVTGTSGNPVIIESYTPGAQFSITLSGTKSLSWLAFRDVTCSGGGNVDPDDTITNNGNLGTCFNFIVRGGGSGGASGGGSGGGNVGGGNNQGGSGGNITYGAAVNGELTGVGTTITITPTIPSGSNTLLIVGISWYDPSSGTVISSVKYNNIDLIKKGNSNLSGNGDSRSEIWYLTGQNPGSANLVVTFSAGNTYATVGAVGMTGVDQATPLGTFFQTSGNGTSNPSLTVTASTGDLVFANLDWSTSSATSTSNNIQLWNKLSFNAESGAAAVAPGAASVNMNWTINQSDSYSIAGVPINAATTSDGGSGGGSSGGGTGQGGGGGGAAP